MTFENHRKVPLMDVYVEVCEENPQTDQANPLPPGPDTIAKYHVGCYSTINNVPTFRSFNLRKNDRWKLNYYVSPINMAPNEVQGQMKKAAFKQLKAWGAVKESPGTEEPDLDHFQKILRKMSEKGFREMAREVDKDQILWVPSTNTDGRQSNIYNRDLSGLTK
jgi:hypothetical protein